MRCLPLESASATVGPTHGWMEKSRRAELGEDSFLSFVFVVNNLEGWGDVFSSYREQVYYYKSNKLPKLSVPLLKCGPLFMKTSIRPTYIIPVGFGRAWWAKANQEEVMATALSWVIKSFVSDPGILCLLLVFVKQYQINLLACKQGENIRDFVPFWE